MTVLRLGAGRCCPGSGTDSASSRPAIWAEPFLAVAVLDVLGHFLQAQAGVADDGDVHIDVLADRRGVDVDMDDLGLGGEGGQIAGDAIVEAGADGDQAIALLHGVVGERAAVHAQHVERLGIHLVESAQAQQRGGDGDIAGLGHLPQRLVGAGQDHATADVEHGLLSAVDHLGRILHLLGMAGVAVQGLALDQVLARGIVHLFRADGRRHVLGQVDQHRARPAAGGDQEGLVDDARQLAHILDEIIPLGARPGDAGHIGFLEGIIADDLGGDLAGETDQRDRVHLRPSPAG